MKQFPLLGVSVCLLAACSQPPAPIALKGDWFYGKNGSHQFAAMPKPDYIPPRPAEPAPVAMMEVKEVSSPVAVEVKEMPAPAPMPIQQAAYTPPSAVQSLPATLPAPEPVVGAEPAPALEPLAIETVVENTPPAPQLANLNDRASNFIWPVNGTIVSHFGPKQNGLVNDGINISAREGEPIWAAASGDVVYSGNELKGYGNMMIVRHSNGWMTAYAHASDMLVKKGDRVNQGDLIGYVGQTGAVTTAQLHFGIRDGKTPIDPETLLPQRVASAN